MSEPGDRRHSERLANIIREYWIDRGHPAIAVWVEAEELSAIRSNIGPNGFPPKSAARSVAVLMAW